MITNDIIPTLICFDQLDDEDGSVRAFTNAVDGWTLEDNTLTVNGEKFHNVIAVFEIDTRQSLNLMSIRAVFDYNDGDYSEVKIPTLLEFLKEVMRQIAGVDLDEDDDDDDEQANGFFSLS